jgi:NTE family protein
MKKLALVFSGGGARGALQVGALRALLEADIHPDMLVGTSVGAVNATYMAVNGTHLDSIDGLVKAWEQASQADLLPTNYFRLALKSFTHLSRDEVYSRMRDFFISQGLTPGFKFGDIDGVELILVATDLNTGEPVLYGREKDQSVLECLLDSITLPPWIMPNEREGHLLMDGGLISNLPIEPALKCGAEAVIALDLNDLREPPLPGPEIGKLITKLLFAVAKRQTELELALAKQSQIPVIRINLLGDKPIALWDFQYWRVLIDQGYELMKSEMPDLVGVV